MVVNNSYRNPRFSVRLLRHSKIVLRIHRVDLPVIINIVRVRNRRAVGNTQQESSESLAAGRRAQKDYR